MEEGKERTGVGRSSEINSAPLAWGRGKKLRRSQEGAGFERIYPLDPQGTSLSTATADSWQPQARKGNLPPVY